MKTSTVVLGVLGATAVGAMVYAGTANAGPLLTTPPDPHMYPGSDYEHLYGGKTIGIDFKGIPPNTPMLVANNSVSADKIFGVMNASVDLNAIQPGAIVWFNNSNGSAHTF